MIINRVNDAQFISEVKKRDLADIMAETQRILKSLAVTAEVDANEWRTRIETLLLQTV